MRKEVLKLFFQNKFLLVLLFLGSFSWWITMGKSGIVYPFGMGFWGANGHDGVWHVALINSLARGSWQMPVFAGETIKNYHIGFDLLIALVHRISGISVTALYFQIVPLLLAMCAGLSSYVLVYNWKKSRSAALWSTFFIYFGGSLGWILNKGESAFWSQQAVSTLINPPFALSLIFIFFGLLCMLKKKWLLAGVFFGVLMEVKAYAGVLVIGSLLAAGVWDYLRNKNLVVLKTFAVSLVISIVLFLPNRGSGGLFIFQPFWFLESMVGSSDRLNWMKLSEAMLSYKSQGVIRKFIPAYGLAFAIFWIGNMGTRLIKEIEVFRWLRNIKAVSNFDVFIMTMILGGGVIPMLFLQQGTPWNTIQFFYYSLAFSAVLAGVSIAGFLGNKSKKFICVFSTIIIILTIPTTLKTLSEVYLPGRPPAKISRMELEALNFLAKQKDGVVLTYPYDPVAAAKAVNNPPRPLYLYDSTAYVSAFSNKSVYLEDEVNLNITNFDWRVRRASVEKFLNTLDQNEAREFLKNNNISYVYWVKPQRAKLGEGQLGLEKIFENGEVDVYTVIDN